MFALVQELWPFVVLLYVLDGLTLVRAGHLLFREGGPGGLTLVTAGLRWLGWRPDGRAFTASRPAVLATPWGVLLPRRPDLEGAALYDPESYDAIGADELRPFEVEHHVLRIGARRPLRLPSAAHAEALADALCELADAPGEAERRRRLAERAAADVLVAFREHHQALGRLRRPLDVLVRLQAILVLGVLPLAVYGASPAVPAGVLAALLLLALGGHLAVLACTVLLARAARRRGLGRVRGVLLPLVLSPPAALRAPVALTRDLYHRFDDATMAAGLLARDELVRYFRRELHAAAVALAGARDDDRSWRWFWDGRRGRLLALLAEVGLAADEVLAPPPRDDPGAVGFCPLCEGEYRPGIASCESCLMPLVPFPELPAGPLSAAC